MWSSRNPCVSTKFCTSSKRSGERKVWKILDQHIFVRFLIDCYPGICWVVFVHKLSATQLRSVRGYLASLSKVSHFQSLDTDWITHICQFTMLVYGNYPTKCPQLSTKFLKLNLKFPIIVNTTVVINQRY